MDKFFEIYRDTKIYYDINSPLIIEVQALYKDNIENRMLVQVKFRNIQEKTIIGCKINVIEYEIDGTNTGDITEYSYLDLNVSIGGVFGSKTPIYLKNIKTRKVLIEVINVVFNDYEVWQNNNKKWLSAEIQKKIEDAFDNNNYIMIIKDKLGNNAKYIPISQNNYWLCTCGAFNIGSSKVCYQCNNSIEDVSGIIDKDVLKKIDQENKKAKDDNEKKLLIYNILVFGETYKGKEEELKNLTIDELKNIENQMYEKQKQELDKRLERERLNQDEKDFKHIITVIIIALILLSISIIKTRFHYN